MINILKEINTKTLLRMLYSNKEYVYFDISVFNVGMVIHPKLTDNYITRNENTWDGYSFINYLEELKEDIKDILESRLIKLSRTWTKNCYYCTWEEHLAKNNISQYNYDRLLRLNHE